MTPTFPRSPLTPLAPLPQGQGQTQTQTQTQAQTPSQSPAFGSAAPHPGAGTATEATVPADPSVGQALLDRALPADAGHFDELRTDEGALREPWQRFAQHLGGPLEDLGRRQEQIGRQISEDGITYNIYSAPGGSSRPWSLEVLPMLLGPQDWSAIERGVSQRAGLLNAVLADVYGGGEVMRQGLLPPALVLGHPGYLRALQGVMPLGGIYLHLVAFDLVRGDNGQWWVVSQRTQAPSGLGYVMQNRLLVSRQFPEAYRALRVQHLASGYRRLLETVQSLAEGCAGGEVPRLALWTPGPYNETYFEHAYLARYLGVPLVEGGDLIVRDERVFLKTVQGLEPLHGLLRRLDDDFCDPLELRSDSSLGVPGLLEAVRAGNVVMANALGTGFLESPALHGFLPALSRHFLQDDLLMPSLPTWWCGEEAAWQGMGDDLQSKVVRTTYPWSPTPGVPSQSLREHFEAVLGPKLSPDELRAWRTRIEQDPAAHTAQDFVPYANTPVWSQGEVVPRGSSLRVYALADGLGGWQVLPGGMTRIATREAGPVSLQLGGSSLDTWVLTDGPVDTFSMLPAPLKLADLVARQRPVASRTGENLFWMGRYTERIEQQWRLLQVLCHLLDDDDEADLPVLRVASVLAQRAGLVPAGTPQLGPSPRPFERALIDALTDAERARGGSGLAGHLASLERLAHSLRERLSPEHDRLLRSMGQDLAARLQRQGRPVADLASVREALDHLALQLGAVTGAQMDRMTRDAGWRLLTVGRLIERLAGMTQLLRAYLQEGAHRSASGFDVLMMLFDSAITFRARFQRRLEWPALVSTLVTDETNPRALACVLRRLRGELAKLPPQAGPIEDLLALLPPDGVGLDLEVLLAAGQGGEQAVVGVCDRLLESAWRLSDELGLRYFAHSEPNAQTMSH